MVQRLQVYSRILQGIFLHVIPVRIMQRPHYTINRMQFLKPTVYIGKIVGSTVFTRIIFSTIFTYGQCI